MEKVIGHCIKCGRLLVNGHSCVTIIRTPVMPVNPELDKEIDEYFANKRANYHTRKVKI